MCWRFGIAGWGGPGHREDRVPHHRRLRGEWARMTRGRPETRSGWPAAAGRGPAPPARTPSGSKHADTVRVSTASWSGFRTRACSTSSASTASACCKASSGSWSMVRQISAACREDRAPSATAAATSGNRAGTRSPDSARRGASCVASRTRPAASRRPIGNRSDNSHRRRRATRLGRDPPRLQLRDQTMHHGRPLPGIGLQRGHQLQQLLARQRRQLNSTQLLLSRRQVDSSTASNMCLSIPHRPDRSIENPQQWQANPAQTSVPNQARRRHSS